MNRFRFGPSDPISKSLKLFKLLGQCLNPTTQHKRTTGSLGAVTQRTLLNKNNYLHKKALLP